MTELWLVRHGETTYNVENRVQGMADSALTERGRDMARALGRGLAKAGVAFDQAYCSDLTRAKDTARLALEAGHYDLSAKPLAGLREENYGRFEGQLTTDFAQALIGEPDFATALLDHRLTLGQLADKTHALTNGSAESNLMVARRFDSALRTIAAATKHRALVVTHGSVVLLWLAFIGFETHGQEVLHNASVSRVRFLNDGFTVASFDDLSYLEQGRS